MQMTSNDFVDYYELLELSPKANFETVERVFRYLAKKHHPDVTNDGEAERRQFAQMIEAFETLREPATRAAYDILWESEQNVRNEMIESANAAKSDCEERANILSMFYGQRRRDMKQPGVSEGRIEDATQCPPEVLSFHLWYFREKGWINREPSGLMSITAEGVDKIEATYSDPNRDMLRIEHNATDNGTVTQPTA